ncbi:hypothetical protein BSKO_01606 [Bryopsis sp. KO-2023]|nr:hypothetical protein BSKO_01606 [Bryopsis sp. KO-2023]
MDSPPSAIAIPLLDGGTLSKTSKDGESKWKGSSSDAAAVSFNYLFLKRFWRLSRIMNIYPALILVLLSIIYAMIVSQVGTVTGKFYATFINKDKAMFVRLMWISAGIYVATTLVKSTTDWLAEFLSLHWRKKLTRHLQKQYCHDKLFYRMELVDNPDQRMAQDLKMFCDSLGQVAKVVAAMPFGVVWYTYLTYKETESKGVIFAAYGSFILSFVLLKFLIGPIASLVFTQEKYEGNLRMAFVRIRNNAEQVAAFQGEETELLNLQKKLKTVLTYQRKVVMRRWLLGFAVTLLDYWGVLLTYLCVGSIIFTGGFSDEKTSGDVAKRISNTSFFLMTLIYSFSQVQDTSQKLSQLAGLTPRVAQLIENLSRPQDKFQEEGDQTALSGEKCLVSIQQLTCATPAAESIVDGLSFSLGVGDSLLVTGRNGCGKSTLMLVLMGLKEKIEGQVKLPPPGRIMMLPQTPLLAPGGLLGEQLAYPSSVPVDHGESMELLRKVGLEGAWQRWVDGDLDQPRDWQSILSPGEIQRICIARVLYHRPKVVILDESTSAVSMESEEGLYAELKNLGIAIISVGHNRNLEAIHDRVLKICGDGQWMLS